MINKEEAKQLVEWGIENGLVRRGVSVNYSVSTLKKRINYEHENRNWIPAAHKEYERMFQQIKAGRLNQPPGK